MIRQALCFAMLVAVSFAQQPVVVPLAAVYTIVPNFKQCDFCNRICYSNYWMIEGNIRKVTFKGKLDDGETASKIHSAEFVLNRL